MKITRFMFRFFCTLLIPAALYTLSPAVAAAPPATLEVTGYAETQIVPDTAYISIGMETAAPTVGIAQTRNNRDIQKIRTALQHAGIAPEDIKTTDFYVSPNYDSKNDTIISYTVTHMLRLKIHDLQRLSALLDTIAHYAPNKIQDLTFVGEHIEGTERQLLQQAVQNGRNTAEITAAAAGKRLGDIKEITIPAAPSYRGTVRSVNLTAATPVAIGTATVRRQVHLVFYLQ